MSSYFLRCCLGCSLIMCLVVMVVLAYLGAEFIQNQGEEKGMNTDVHCSG
jgi:Tfp pilus assembly protein PilX